MVRARIIQRFLRRIGDSMERDIDIKDLLAKQLDYFQFLFEQEQKRALSIISGAKVYIAFLVFILGTIFLKVVPAENILLLFTTKSISAVEKLFGIGLVTISLFTLTIAVVLSMTVMKVWSYDRLCDPIERFKETLSMKMEEEVLSKILSDFTIATNRNNVINNMRAKRLSLALNWLLSGTILSIFSAVILNVILNMEGS